MQTVSGEIARKTRRLFASKGNNDAQWRTQYIGARTAAVEPRPQAFLVEMVPDSTVTAHFHQVDEFQVMVAGSGNLGRNAVPLIALHYVDHHTAYGPIHAGGFGLSFFTIRVQSDPGGIRIGEPGYRELLKPTTKRYLLAESIMLSTEPVLRHRETVAVENVFDDAGGGDGLGASMLRLGACMKTLGPHPASTGGQYYLVLNGSLRVDAIGYAAWSMVYAEPTDAPLEVCAGDEGLEVLILNFPRQAA